MPSHYDPAVGYEVKEASLEENLSALEQRLIEALHTSFQAMLGIPIPRADQAELLKVDTALKYHSKVSFDEFMDGAV